MNIKELNEAIGRALNEISDAPVNAVADKRKDTFEKNRADFYLGKDNADELRKSKFALDKNTYLTNKREFRKNYDGRYLKVEYDDDQAVYDMYVEDQLELGRTIEDIEAEDPKCYTVWVMGADKQTLENDKDGKPITFNYASVWKADEMSSEEIIAETQKQLGKELVPDGIKLVWNNDESVADKKNIKEDLNTVYVLINNKVALNFEQDFNFATDVLDAGGLKKRAEELDKDFEQNAKEDNLGSPLMNDVLYAIKVLRNNGYFVLVKNVKSV